MLELFTAFKEAKFHEDTHQYFIRGEEYKSVTTFLKRFQPHFDAQRIAPFSAKKRGISVEEILAEWEAEKDKGSNRGSSLHLYIEKDLLGKAHSDETLDPKLIDQYERFKKTFLKDYTPIVCEKVIYDDEYRIAGMIDAVFHHRPSRGLVIIDWKTNKKIDNKSYDKYEMPLDHLASNKINDYALQISIYRYLLQKNCPTINFCNQKVVWFQINNEEATIFDLPYLKKEVLSLLEFIKFANESNY
jgi:ATP-dependent exoDNAse (exonuclease V) beta subunit